MPDAWRLPLAVLLLILAILLLLLFLTRSRINRMAKYLLASTVAHALLFLLTINLLMESGVVDLEQVAPSISVKVRALEQELGVEILPPAPTIDIPESATQAAASHTERRPTATPQPNATAALLPTEAPAAPAPQEQPNHYIRLQIRTD